MFSGVPHLPDLNIAFFDTIPNLTIPNRNL